MWLRYLGPFLSMLLLEYVNRPIACSNVDPSPADPPALAPRTLQQTRSKNIRLPRSLQNLESRITFHPRILNADWILDFHDFTCLLPAAFAAAKMQDFYEEVAALAATTSIAAQDYYRIVLGEITLEVKGPTGVPIFWIVVQAFANYMLDMTKRGYTNTYQVNFIFRQTGQLLTFSLWVGYIRAAINQR